MKKKTDNLDNRIYVLGTGFVELVDHMGDDERIVEAARISYEARSVEDAMKFVSQLWHSGHTSPFEQVVLTFRIKAPIFVARQMMRHRTARVNELSLRYTKSKLEFYIPQGDRLGDYPDSAKKCIDAAYSQAKSCYQTLLASGVRYEVARCVLPVSTFTEFFWQMDLHNLLHFLTLRCAKSAQWETWEYAKAIEKLAATVAPAALAAWEAGI